MKNQSTAILRLTRALLFLSGIALIIVIFVPMWRIDLDAPQYPEGLQLLIYPDKIAGNVDIINGLNHYIGMKTIHTADFIEFRILPYLIALFALAFFITAFINSKKAATILFIAFVAFGIVAMVDFWKWEYDYGHNLNPEAAIVVPGMAYQPPLIGYKQLLNFGAYSTPSIGGWLFVAAGILLIICLFLFSKSKKSLPMKNSIKAMALLMFISIASCSADPQTFRLGIDHCDYCSMTITTPRFGAEIITQKGKIFKFDEIGCMLEYVQKMDKEKIQSYYSADYLNQQKLLSLDSAVLIKNESFRSPMGSNIAAFPDQVMASDYIKNNGGQIIAWKNILNK